MADFEETVRQVETLDRRIYWSQVDIRHYESLATALQKGVNEFGRLDIVVSNAAMSGVGSLTEDMTVGDWQDEIDVNLSGQFKTCTAAVDRVCSIHGLR